VQHHFCPPCLSHRLSLCFSFCLSFCLSLLLAPVLSGLLLAGCARTPDQGPSTPPGVPTRLLTDGVAEPLLTGSLTPHFTWQVNDSDRNEIQTAARILVASEPDLLTNDIGDMWDSGWLSGPASTAVVYAGAPLAGATRYWWKVRTRDRQGLTGAWSAPARFDTGLTGNEWTADFIWDGTDNVNNVAFFRREFTLPAAPARARVFVSAHDDYVLYINGREIGRGPARSDPYRYGQYNARDIADALQAGPNVIAARAHWHGLFRTSGVNGHPAFILQARIELTDGDRSSEVLIATDASWRCLAATPWREVPYTSFGGADGARNRCAEIYDGRLEPAGWTEPGFDDEQWAAAGVVRRGQYRFYPQLVGEQRAWERLNPVNVQHDRTSGDWIVDFGQCLSGWPVLTMTANAPGDTITIRYFQADGLTGASGWDRYLCRGGRESFEPDIGYGSFRFLRISGYTDRLDPENVRGVRAHTDLDVRGSFRSSEPILNAIHEMCERSARQAVQSGVVSVDANREQATWTADAWIVGNVLLYNHGAAEVVRKTIRDYAAEQLDNGDLYACSPGAKNKIPEWAFSWPMMLWQYYLFTGDEVLLREVYGNLERLISYYEQWRDRRTHLLHDTAVWEITDLPRGDYIDESGAALTAQNCQYCRVLEIAAEVAGVLERTREAARWRRLARQVRQGINRHLFDGRSRYRDSLDREAWHQLPSAWALRFDIVPERYRAAVVDHITSRPFEPHVYGADCFFDALYTAGEGAYLHGLLTETGCGRWEWMARTNGRVCTEDWGTGEWNHAWSSSPGSFLPKYLGGIAPTGPGFSTFDVRPIVEGELSFVETVVPTVRGEIGVRWEKDVSFLNPRAAESVTGAPAENPSINANRALLTLALTVPANTIATLYLPVGELNECTIMESEAVVWESGRFQSGPAGIRNARRENQAVRFTLGSGEYSFTLHEHR